MALDQHLLTSTTQDQSQSWIRVYSWKEPTVTRGYFQQDGSGIPAELQNCPCVRRLTGGGAILHHNEITYSCVVPETHPVRHSPSSLYDIIHSSLVRLLAQLGVDCSMRRETLEETADHQSVPTKNSQEPFLCFLRSDPKDVVCCGHKIIGSAQRRRRGTVLQHGSILISHSNLLPEIPGILDLYPEFSVSDFSGRLPDTLAAAISNRFNVAACENAGPSSFCELLHVYKQPLHE